MGIFNNISRYDDEEEFDINYFLSLLSSQGIHFDQNKNLDMGNKRIMRLANPQVNTDSVNLQYLMQILKDYYEKTYLDGRFNQKADKSQLQNYFQKNHDINMGNNFKIINLKEGTDPQDAVSKHQLNQVEVNFLKLDGRNKMAGDLNLNGKKLIFPGEIDMDRKLITNLDTKVDDDLSAVNMITLKNKLTDKADNSRVNLKADKLYVDHNFFEIGEDIDMRDKEIYNLQTRLDDLAQSPDLGAYYKDQSRVINKEYIHNRCLINDDKDSDFDLKQKLITNCELVESLYDDATLVPKKYVDNKLKTNEFIKKNSNDNVMQSDLNMNNFNIQYIKYTTITGCRISNLTVTSTANISNLNVINNAVMERITLNKSQNLTDFDAVNKHYLDSRLQNINTNRLLKTDGSNQMNADLDVGNNKIINLKEPTESETATAANVGYVNKIKKSLTNDMSNLHAKNLFLPFMPDLKYWKGDSKIRNFKLIDKNLGIHDINFRCLEFEIEHEVKPNSNGLLYQYKGNITLHLNDLISEEYALTIELSPKWNVNTTMAILSTNVAKLKHKSYTFETFIQQYINFEKISDNTFITFEIIFDLKHDIPLVFDNYWEKAYIILYGIRDLTGGDSTAYETIFDKPLYSYKNKIFFTQNIDMNVEFTLRGLKNPTEPGEAANKSYVDTFVHKKNSELSTYVRMNGFNYFTIFKSFIDFTSLFFIDFRWDSNFNQYIINFINYGSYNMSHGVRPNDKIGIDNFSSDGLNLDLFYFNSLNTSFNKFTFFLSFKHKKDKELVIDFISKDPNPLTSIAFRLRIDNSKIYFEPLHAKLIPKFPGDSGGAIQITAEKNLSNHLRFVSSYIGKRLMLWFTYDLKFKQTINPQASLSKTLIIKGLITMKLNNENLPLVYNVDQTIRLRDDEFINDLSKINEIDFINFDTTGYKFGFTENVLHINDKERLKCLWNEIKNGLFIK